MRRRYWWQSWPRFLLWSHVIGVVGFYLIVWWRTAPSKDDRVEVLPPENPTSRHKATDGEMPANRTGHPMVSIIVPARNEERNIRRCIQSLLDQDYDNYEIIVVDDESNDNTGCILDELGASHPDGRRLFVLRLRELPDGWAGKPHAIHSGVQESRGAWLLFTDADTWHAPTALRSAITQALAEQDDMFTMGSKQELPTFWDKALMPMAYLGISMLYPPRLVNDPLSKVAVANGQFILLRREVYRSIGGYARPELRETLLDDRDLAHVVKEQGYKLHFVDGRELVSVHMYRGLGDIWRGWRKNAYLGNRGGLPFVLTQLLGLSMISIVPFMLPLLALLTRNRHRGAISAKEASIATALEQTSLFAYRTWLNRQMNVSWYYTFTHPLAGAIFTGILGQSAWRILSKKGVDWRGREYHNGRSTQKVPSHTMSRGPALKSR